VNGSLKFIGRLHVITDTAVQDRFDHVALAQFAIRGGADSIQLRDKYLSNNEFRNVARAVLAVCRRHGVPLIINDRLDVAARIGADGVHLGQTDTAIGEARRRLGPGIIIGGSAGNPDEAREAVDGGADYVGFGHVFPTHSKSKPGPAVGIEGVRAVCAAVAVPVIAIGGITPANARGVLDAGAWGVAVIGAVCGAEDPEAATRRLANITGTTAEEGKA
jgi:thiamine-phosphate pyrophosphorylase